MAEGLLCEATAALDVLCPLQEGGQLGLQHLGGGAERMEGRKRLRLRSHTLPRSCDPPYGDLGWAGLVV